MEKIELPRAGVLLAIAAVLLVAGCNSDQPVVAPLNANTMQVTSSIEGDLTATDATADSSTGVYSMLAHINTGAPNGEITVNVVVPKSSSVPYSVSVGTDPSAELGYTVNTTAGNLSQYLASQAFGAGRITVTQISPTLEGSFSGTLWETTLTTPDTVEVLNNGEFNASWQ